MEGALYTNSFLYMIAIEALALIGLLIMIFRKKVGFYMYVISQIIFLLYPIVSGTVDTVFGLLIIPAIAIPVAFIVYYSKNISKFQV